MRRHCAWLWNSGLAAVPGPGAGAQLQLVSHLSSAHLAGSAVLGCGVRLGMIHACRRALEPEQRLMLQGLLYFLL
jgi:hypothetical protein|eukprot:COSAG01_NODE_4281_length_5177_cov_31.361560_4_plen_75_part_00